MGRIEEPLRLNKACHSGIGSWDADRAAGLGQDDPRA